MNSFGETISAVRIASLLIGLTLIATALWDGFETVVLPRTVTRRLRLARIYFRVTWRSWSAVATRIRRDSRRERFLAVYGPVSLLGLLTVWAICFIAGFALLQWADGSRRGPRQKRPDGRPVAGAAGPKTASRRILVELPNRPR